MEKVTITSTVDLSDSGCNACGLVEDTIYTLTMNDVAVPIDDLTVSSMVMAIALRKGYKQELVMGLGEESILYKKENQVITLEEGVNQLTYSTPKQTIETINKITDMEQLLAKVNEILNNLFLIEKIEFIL
ncbi:DUF4809 family protein [Enterococcus rivorum]|uniref:DUF4809 domain-containing protein n=1 Tax=Enterococcus rivorum TaxID=762845 RepID=A0A1E5KX63_9ENTE|nr:DUF4809 family protein [Enterococcus rivorum]MBP2097238.1 hypothetical protein [Enterococcus rivorum]OEH82408.1 DUF4809 domain-containing protein [Enterococcus rivorum]